MAALVELPRVGAATVVRSAATHSGAAGAHRAQDDWRFGRALIGVATLGTALAVSPHLGLGNEAFVVPKALVLALAAAGAAWVLSRVRHYHPAALDWWLGAYLLHGVFSAILGAPNWAIAATVLAPECSALLVYALVATSVSEQPGRRARVIDVVIIAVVLVCALALVEALGVELPWGGMRRPHSTLGNRNFVAADAAVVAALLGVRLMGWSSPLRLAAFALMITTVLITRCRSAWLGLAVSLPVIVLLSLRLRARPSPTATFRLAAVAVLAATLAVAVPWPGLRWSDGSTPFASSVSRLLEYGSGTGRERLGDLKLALAMAADHPFFGLGVRSWDDAASAYAHLVNGRHATAEHFWTSPNSDLARTLGERGVVGLALLLGVVAAAGRGLLRDRSRPPLESVALGAGLSVLVVNALLDAPLFRPSSLLLGAILGGLVRVRGPRALKIASPFLGVSLAVVASGLVAVAVARTFASALIAAQPHEIEPLTRAQAWFPRPDVAELLTFRLAQRGSCADAERAGARARELAPHHWGVPQVLARCWLTQGHRDKAFAERAERDRLEPHADMLLRKDGDPTTGYEKPATAAPLAASPPPEAKSHSSPQR